MSIPTVSTTVTASEFIAFVKDFKGYQFAGLKTSKVCKLVKKDRNTKESTEGNIVTESATYKQIGFGYEYQKSVNNRRDKEGHAEEFTANPLPFGQEWLEGSKTITKRVEQHYVRFTLINGFGCVKTYTLNGEPATYSEVMSILHSSHLQGKKGGSARQECEDVIRVIGYKVENIAQLNVNGMSFNLTH